MKDKENASVFVEKQIEAYVLYFIEIDKVGIDLCPRAKQRIGSEEQRLRGLIFVTAKRKNKGSI